MLAISVKSSLYNCSIIIHYALHNFIWLFLTVYTKCIAFILIWSNQQIPVIREACRDGIHYVAFSIIHHKRDPSRFCLFQWRGQMQVDSSHWATSAAIKLRRLSPREKSHPLPTMFAHVWVGDASTGGGIWRGFHIQAQFSGPIVRRLRCYLWHRRPHSIKSNKCEDRTYSSLSENPLSSSINERVHVFVCIECLRSEDNTLLLQYSILINLLKINVHCAHCQKTMNNLLSPLVPPANELFSSPGWTLKSSDRLS